MQGDPVIVDAPDLVPPNGPMRRCDIVMKGGVTSGIVYPPAVRELADAFRFVNIGGTSAGAIAASLTAAAEYRRHAGGGLAGFDRLQRVPHDLAQNQALRGLFAPNQSTKLVFDRLMAFVTDASAGERSSLVLSLPFAGSQRRVAWTIAGVAALLAAIELRKGPAAIPGAIATLGLGLVTGYGVGLYRTLRHAIDLVVANGFGLASGIDERDPENASVLGTWLSNLLDEIAGLPAGEHLTFGHLWYGRTPTDRDYPTLKEADKHDREPLVNLQMVSTCVSHGRPYTFPTGSNIFFFNPAVLQTCVPPGIVAHLIAKARTRAAPDADRDIRPFVPMPVDRDLPVVLAARMSLAFPILLTAVQLGAAAYTEKDELTQEDPNAKPLPEPCWFADGGLSSNFPVHLFDSSLPRRPTFGINLGRFEPGDADYDPHDNANNVWMPPSNKAGLVESWSRFTSLPDYLGAVFNAVKDWNDNVTMKVPGFRDRIVTVKLRASEGGLNLDMDAAKIAALADRGREAGRLLVKRFARPSTGTFDGDMDWENHRIVRYRVAMSAAQRFVEAYSQGYADHQPGDVDYGTLLRKGARDGMRPYKFGTKQTARRAAAITRLVAGFGTWLERKGIDFTAGAPRPQPDLAKRARY